MTLHQKTKGATKGGVGQLAPHDSAKKHVTGAAVYIDDIAEPLDLLHVQIGLSTRAHARIQIGRASWRERGLRLV